MKTGKRPGKRLIGLLLVLLPAVSCDQSDPQAHYDSIEGIFKCQEASPHAGVRNYLGEIDGVKDAGGLFIISNFHNKGENEFLYAELSNDTLWIVNQPISDISVNGKGPVSADFRTIHLDYVTDDGITILDYYATYSR
jgi:hypothetical protein